MYKTLIFTALLCALSQPVFAACTLKEPDDGCPCGQAKNYGIGADCIECFYGRCI